MKEHLKRRALILLALAIIVGVTSLFLYNVSFNPSFSAMDLVTSASKKSRQKPKEDTTENVAGWLTEVNQTEAKTDRIAWECGCMEKKCGACAMLINGYPRLACSVFLKDVKSHGKILLEPFQKFPLVRDLIVDRSVMFQALQDMKLWIQEKDDSDYFWDRKLQYQAGQCLQCGCCLEVCPNFLADNAFSGAAAIVNAYRDIEQQTSDEHRKEMIQGYRQKFFAYCGQSFSCKRSARKNFLWMKYRQG